MTRMKVQLQYIANDSQRKSTFRKRKKGLVKKVNELTTLCGIEACAIIYSPYEAQPDIWPSQAGAQRLLSRYVKLPETDKTKTMMDQEGFLKRWRDKEYEKLKKQWEVNREKEMTHLMNQALARKLSSLQDLTVLDLNHLGWVIDQNLKSLKRRVHDELIKGSQGFSVEMQHFSWFNDLTPSPGSGVGAAGDGNPSSNNSNLHFP